MKNTQTNTAVADKMIGFAVFGIPAALSVIAYWLYLAGRLMV